MTQPSQGDLNASADQAEERLRLSEAALLALLLPLVVQLNTHRLTGPGVALDIEQLLAQAQRVDWPTATRQLLDIQNDGIQTAVEQLGLGGVDLSAIETPDTDPARAAEAVESLSKALINRLQNVARYNQIGADQGTMAAVQAVNQARAGLSAIAVDQYSGFQMDTARQNKAALVWHGERNACLICTGYIGAVSLSSTDHFDSAGFDGRKTTIASPPVHPHCRCQLVVVAGDPWPLATAYRREAVRSVLKGWRLESESNAARLAAAEALLRKQPAAPRSVLDQARRAVKRGSFTGGGVVPTPGQAPN